MRQIKTLGSLVVAVCAVSSFLGVGMASAHHLIGFCKNNEGLACAAGNLLSAGTLKAHSAKAELKNSAFFSTPEICESDVSVTAQGVDANPIKGTVTSLTFTKCTGPCIKATAIGLPWAVELSMAVEGGTAYTFSISKGNVRLSECTFNTECEFGVPVTGLNLSAENGTDGGVIKANGAPVEYKGGSGSFVCGANGTWTATYAASPTKSWWFTLLGV